MSPSRRQVVAALAAAGVAPATVASAQEDGNGTDNQSQDDPPEGTPEGEGDDQDGEENQGDERDDEAGDGGEQEGEDGEESDGEEDQDEEGEEGEFSPELTIRPNNLVARVGEREDGTDPDTVTVYTEDGSVFEFDGTADNEWEQGEAFDVGYTRTNSRGKIGGWHGVVERVEATRDDETVAVDNDAESTLEVTCTMWKTPDYPPTEFTVISDGATKHHWNRGEDDLSREERQYGSPGRRLQTVVEHDPEAEMRVDFGDRSCYPNERKACYFDCTSVTVEREELNQGEDRIEDVQLRFADGTYENPSGDADEADNGAFELPVTLEGTGENEGKIIENLHFKVPSGEYYYRNLDVEECRQREAETREETPEEPEETPGESSEGGESTESADDSSGSGGSDEAGAAESGEENEGGEPPSSDGSDGDAGGETPDGSSDDPDPAPGESDGGSGGAAESTESADGGAPSQETDEPGGSADADPTTDRGTADTPVDEADEPATPESDGNPADEATVTEAPDGATETPESESSGNESAPGLPDGEPADEQPGLGVVAALGGLVGFGELVRRRLDDEPPGRE